MFVNIKTSRGKMHLKIDYKLIKLIRKK